MSWLSSQQLERFILHHADAVTRRGFLGVFPMNQLPRHVPHLPALLIVNTQTDNQPGQHWLCLFLTGDGRGEVFDSFGMAPPPSITRWLRRRVRDWTYNRFTYQSPLSATCGAFVLYVALHRFRHRSLTETLRVFTSSLTNSDKFVTQYCRTLNKR